MEQVVTAFTAIPVVPVNLAWIHLGLTVMMVSLIGLFISVPCAGVTRSQNLWGAVAGFLILLVGGFALAVWAEGVTNSRLPSYPLAATMQVAEIRKDDQSAVVVLDAPSSGSLLAPVFHTDGLQVGDTVKLIGRVVYSPASSDPRGLSEERKQKHVVAARPVILVESISTQTGLSVPVADDPVHAITKKGESPYTLRADNDLARRIKYERAEASRSRDGDELEAFFIGGLLGYFLGSAR